MINNDRIVPITAIDLISMYALILTVGGVGVTALDATTTDGQFEQNTDNVTVLCTEPVKTFNLGTNVVSGSIYFVPAYDYSGFTVNGTTVTTEGDEVTADGRTLYKALLQGGAVTITKVGF